MRFLKDPFLADSIRFPGRAIKKLHKNKFSKNLFLLYIDPGTNEIRPRLEVMRGIYFWQPYFKQQDFILVGLAKSESEATDIILQIMDKTLEDGRFLNPASYLLQLPLEES